MQIQLNGEPHTLTESQSLADLLEALHLNPQQVAVAKNLEVILRSNLAQTRMSEGDKIEIFQAVGGG